MKFQYSLRTLIIACLIAGIGVYFGVQAYLAEHWRAELYDRGNEVSKEIDRIIGDEMKRYQKMPAFSGNHSSFAFANSGNSWFRRSEITGRIKEKVTPLFCVRVSGSRNGREFAPMVFEYDGSLENDELIRKLKAFCDERKLRYEVRKVEKVSE